MSGEQASRLASIQDGVSKVFIEAPLGLIKFSALLRGTFKKLTVDEGVKSEILVLLCRGPPFGEECFKRFPELKQLIAGGVGSREAKFNYLKCFLAKALSEFFNEKIHRYKNEAARRMFLRDVADVAELLHLAQPEEMLEKLRGLQLNERVDAMLSELVGEVERLIGERWSPDLECEKAIDEGQAEIENYVSRMEKLTGFERGTVGKYQKGLLVHCFFDPWYVEDERSELWGVEFYPILNVLNVQPPYAFFDALRRGLLAREAAHLFTPTVMEGMEKAYEQMDYCAYRILEEAAEAELWEYVRHGLREESKNFDGINYYLEWEALVGGDFLSKMFSRLKSIGRFRSKIDLAEYQAVADSLALKPKPISLTLDEASILRLLCEKPLISASELSQRTGMSIPTVQKLLKSLRIKANIWPSLLVDTNKFGVIGFLVSLKGRPGITSELIEAIWAFPYCGRIYKVFGEMDLLCYFHIPVRHEKFIHEYLTCLRREDLIEKYFLYKINDFYYNFNPRFYDAEVGGWNVLWDEWGLWLKEYLSNRGWLHALQVGRREEGKKKVKVTRLDLEIIRLLRVNSRYPFSEVGFKLGVSGAYVGQKFRRLVNAGVVRPTIASFRIGLDESAFVVFDCEEETAMAIKSALDELPMWQGFKVTGDMEGLASVIYVPTGEIQELFYALDRYLIEPKLINKHSIHIIEKWTGRRRWLPVELYKDAEGWIFEEEKYLEELRARAAEMFNRA